MYLQIFSIKLYFLQNLILSNLPAQKRLFLTRKKQQPPRRNIVQKLECSATFQHFSFRLKTAIAIRKSDFRFYWPNTGTDRILGNIHYMLKFTERVVAFRLDWIGLSRPLSDKRDLTSDNANCFTSDLTLGSYHIKQLKLNGHIVSFV